VQAAPTPLRVLGDGEALQQLLGNLLDNAFKYTPAGGRVGVRTGRDGDVLFVDVTDTGLGIEVQHQERIFERFYRVDKGRSRDVGGTGLGLSIVKHIARAHGGGVTVRSAPGQGSTFRISLPPAP
jgi:two-component system phosphate regulon sensor histidine kinase PhoR